MHEPPVNHSDARDLPPVEDGAWRAIDGDTAQPSLRAVAASRHTTLTTMRAANLGSLSDEAGRIVRRHGRLLMLATALVMVPRTLFDVLAAHAAHRSFTRGGTGFDRFSAIFDRFYELDFDAVSSAVALIANSVAVALIGALVASIVCADRMGEPSTGRHHLRSIGRRSPVVLAAWALAHLPWLVIGWIALAGPGAILFVVLLALLWATVTVFVIPAVVAERLGPLAAFKRSWRLMRIDVSRAAGAVLVAVLLSVVVRLGFELIPYAATSLLTLGETPFAWLFSGLASMAATVFTTPIVAGVTASAYLDVRVRSEALDLFIEAERVFE